jgi:hypothetical protein
MSVNTEVSMVQTPFLNSVRREENVQLSFFRYHLYHSRAFLWPIVQEEGANRFEL